MCFKSQKNDLVSFQSFTYRLSVLNSERHLFLIKDREPYRAQIRIVIRFLFGPILLWCQLKTGNASKFGSVRFAIKYENGQKYWYGKLHAYNRKIRKRHGKSRARRKKQYHKVYLKQCGMKTVKNSDLLL